MSTSKKNKAATTGTEIITQWLQQKGLHPFAFQQETWQHMQQGQSGIVNAPTGCGKTFSVFLGTLIQFIDAHPHDWQTKKNSGLQLLWITPLRALGKDLARAMQEVVDELGMLWKVSIRNGDTDTAERARQKKQMPEVLIITPESLHLLLAMKGHHEFFKTLRTIAVDEWHELIGSKRGVQVELAVAYISQQFAFGNLQGTFFDEKKENPNEKYKPAQLYPITFEKATVELQTANCKLQLWGISATIGNLDEAREVLLRPLNTKGVIVKANMRKDIAVHSIIPDEIEKYPWAGHLGIKLVEKVIPIIERSNTTLIFINTRGMAERWYQTLLDVAPQLAGAIALHHGSIEQELRLWVEDALHTQKLKAVVATASLDLGVDFRPVDTVIQVGSPKGVSRFLQRAGRAGHQPGEVSNVYFLPTHSLELLEAAALKEAIAQNEMESKDPLSLCFDVLCQFLCTLAVGDGFRPDTLFPIIQSSWCFQTMTQDEWLQVLMHITEGGKALQQYDEYRKVEVIEGIYKITSRRIALRHRMNIGTIVSDAMLKVKFMTGGYIGHIEEYFISRLEPGDVFTLAGRNVELVQIKDMTVLVRKSNQKKSIVPSWMGGRMSLTANLGKVLREVMGEAQLLVAQKAENPVGSIAPLSRGEGPGESKEQSYLTQNLIIQQNKKSTENQAPLSRGEGPGERTKNLPGYLTADKKLWPTLIAHAKEMRRSPTVAEKLLWQNLRNRKLAGYKFRRQHPILYFITDFVCLEKKLIVELDGQPHTETEQRKADFFRACLLAELGYRILRFWNHEIEKNQLVVLEKISKRLALTEDVTSIQQRLHNASPIWWNEYVRVNSNENESSKSFSFKEMEESGHEAAIDLTPRPILIKSGKKNIGVQYAAYDLTPGPSPVERGEKTPINVEEDSFLSPNPSPGERGERTPKNVEEFSLLTPNPSPEERGERTPKNVEENNLLSPGPSPMERGEKSIALSPELFSLTPLFQLQAELSHIPAANELLIEHHQSKEGYHLLVYPFEGRQVHEAMSAILAYRLSRILPITFSIAMNDYGFELLSDVPIPVDDTNVYELFSLEDLFIAMQQSANHVEMAMRKFRDIAVVAGLIFQGLPGEQKKARHLQASASLLFKVFKEVDPNNLLLRQAYAEVYEQQMEEERLRNAFARILQQSIIITWPKVFTPLSFPINADSLNRNHLSSENLEDRIRKMAAALNAS